MDSSKEGLSPQKEPRKIFCEKNLKTAHRLTSFQTLIDVFDPQTQPFHPQLLVGGAPHQGAHLSLERNSATPTPCKVMALRLLKSVLIYKSYGGLCLKKTHGGTKQHLQLMHHLERASLSMLILHADIERIASPTSLFLKCLSYTESQVDG